MLDGISLAEIVPFIDWSPFFQSWELTGKYPRIFDDTVIGKQARALYDDARVLLDTIVGEGKLKARAVYGFFPANSMGDDLVVYEDESRTTERARFPMLRQQWEREGQSSFRSLADYVAPASTGLADYLGGFAVSTGFGADELAAHFERDHDDYNSIMTKALADRLAEALAEMLHQKATASSGAFGSDEGLSADDLIDEKYRGIQTRARLPRLPRPHREADPLVADGRSRNPRASSSPKGLSMHPGRRRLAASTSAIPRPATSPST